MDLDTPFVLVYNALWRMAERNGKLMKLVRPLNRIKYENIGEPKFNIEDGDLPELSLTSRGVNSNIMNSSSTSSVVRQYGWEITTGEYQMNLYNAICWELYRAMIDWDVTLCALEWPKDSDWHFIIKANTISAEEGTFMRDMNRGISGWAGIWIAEVEMHFNTSDLRIS
jgi:hypothetical protein